MQYEEACQRVYGEPYADWKKKNQKKASSPAFDFGGNWIDCRIGPTVGQSMPKWLFVKGC